MRFRFVAIVVAMMPSSVAVDLDVAVAVVVVVVGQPNELPPNRRSAQRALWSWQPAKKWMERDDHNLCCCALGANAARSWLFVLAYVS